MQLSFFIQMQKIIEVCNLIITAMLSRAIIKFCYSNIFQTDSKMFGASALWAELIFKYIKEPKEHTNNALIDQVIELEFNKADLQKMESMMTKWNGKGDRAAIQNILNDQQNTVKSIFKTFKGAQLPPLVIDSQMRLQSVKNKNQAFTFCPNRIVTPRIFTIMDSDIFGSSMKNMTVGEPGISKTMAYVLGATLKSFSAQFHYMFPTESKQLIQVELLSPFPRKFIYTSFTTKNHSFQYYARLILSQCLQLSQQSQINEIQSKIGPQNNKADMKNYQLLLYFINEKYRNKGIVPIYIIDQINTLSSVFQNYNNMAINYKQLLKNYQKFSEQHSTTLKRYKSTQQLTFQMNNIYISFDPYSKIFNSSKNIQQNILDQPKHEQIFLYGLDLTHHSSINMKSFKYQPFKFSKREKKDILRLIWYLSAKYLPKQFQNTNKFNKTENIGNSTQLEEKLNESKQKNQRTSLQEKRDKVQKLFIQKCDKLAVEQQQLSSFYTPLAISEAVKSYFDQNKQEYFDFSLNQKNIQYFVQKIHNSVVAKGEDIIYKKSQKFLNNQNKVIKKNRMKFLLECSQKLAKGICFLPAEQLEYLDKDIFEFQNKKTGYSAVSLKITQSQLNSLKWRWFKKLFDDSSYDDLVPEIMNNSRMQPHLLQFMVIKAMREFRRFNLKFSNENFQSQNCVSVRHLLGSNANIYVTLSKIFKQLIKNPTRHYVFGYPIMPRRPIQKDIIQENESPNNPSFDFIAAKMTNGKFKVCSFDITLLSDKNDIKKKLKKALFLFKQKLQSRDEDFFLKQFLTAKYLEQLTQGLKENTIKSTIQILKILDRKNPGTSLDIYLINQMTKICKQQNIRTGQSIIKMRKLLEQNCLYYNIEPFLDKISQWKHYVICRPTFYQDADEVVNQYKKPVQLKNKTILTCHLLNIEDMGINSQKGNQPKNMKQLIQIILKD